MLLWGVEVLPCFSKAQSKESDEECLDQMAADACIWLQSFHMRENNLIHSENFEISCGKSGIYTMDWSLISPSRSGTEQM